MSIKTQPIHLITQHPSDSAVKQAARGFFRFVREAATHAREVPGIVQKAAGDIREAWEESSRPKV